MNPTAASWQSTAYLLLPAPDAAALLMLPGGAGWTLPTVALPYRLWPPQVGRLREAITAQLGIEFPVLRCAWERVDRERNVVEYLFILERASAGGLPLAGGAWLDRDQLAALTLAVPALRPALESALAELDGAEVPALRAPWARFGWFTEASVWIQRELARLGDQPLAPITQVRSWPLSTILRVTAARGDLYFKAPNLWPLVANEPQIMRALAEWYPHSIPMPLALDVERRWMLLDDFGPPLRDNPDLDLWDAALRQYVPLQRDSASRLEALAALGCSDRRLETLPASLDRLVGDAEMLALLDEAEADRLIALAPRLKHYAERLSEYHLPTTLVHGDLHPGNIAVTCSSFLYYDWTDACIGHPFFDLVTITGEVPDDPVAALRLRDVYLALWTDYEPLERLLEAWALAEPLGVLHQVISYRNIYGVLEADEKPGFAGSVKFWARMLLTSLAD